MMRNMIPITREAMQPLQLLRSQSPTVFNVYTIYFYNVLVHNIITQYGNTVHIGIMHSPHTLGNSRINLTLNDFTAQNM